MSRNEDRRNIIRHAKTLGYAIADETACNIKFVHIKLKSPVFINPHSGDYRAMKNAKKLLERKLKEIEEPKKVA